MITRLPRQAVLRYLDRLADDLTPRQMQRLRGLADLIDGDGRIPMTDALAVATPGGDDTKAQDAFRKFRAAFDTAADAAGVQVRLVSDQRKAPPRDRVCWFEGEDLTGDELAVRSRREADRRGDEETVTATVTEVLPTTTPDPGHGGVVVHVEIARKAPEPIRRLERAFVELLSGQASAGPGYRVTSILEPLLGADVESERRRLREAADLVVELDSTAASRDTYPGVTTRLPLRTALDAVPRSAGPADAIVHEARRPFSQQPNRNARIAFVHRTLDLIAERLREPATSHEPLAMRREPDAWVRGVAGRRLLREKPVTSQVGETSLASAALTEPAARRLSEPLPAVDRLVTWATEPSPNARHLCALLGDVGMGKTTTAQLFTLALLDRRKHDVSVPLPILFDLRDLPAQVVRETTGVKKIVQALLEAGDLGQVPTVEEVLDLVASGNCVLIFDGLDEVLVHLEPHAGQVFTRTLWRAAEELWRSQPAGARADRPSKLLLSCRTHYFRSIRDETNHFTGQHRDGPTSTAYLALLMLPFDEEQIRAYLEANVPGADVDRLLDLIDSVHNLREIAERPLTLRMIAEQLETVEQAKLAGRTVRTVDLYASFVRQWLERDDGKHCLLPDHKQLLMEHLAAQLWRTGRTSWDVADVEQWMLEFLAGRPELELHYPARAPDLWKEDLRTATFLVRRDDDTFGFAHTSLSEYFLARYLDRALELPPERSRARWQMAVPSPETLDFLGQLLAGHDSRRRTQNLTALAAIVTQLPDGRADAAAVLAFAYSLTAARAGHPDHTPASRVLTGANLAGWRIDAGNHRLDLRRISLAGADLTATVIGNVDLSHADLTAATLTRAEILDSTLRHADLQRAELTGTVFRSCDLSAIRWTGSTAHRTQALLCTQPPDRRAGWLMAPARTPRPTHARLASFTGHSGAVLGGAWSPDGTQILTTSDDWTARIWDATSGHELRTLTGHSNWVRGAAWNPDGTQILTTSDDGTARIWDATSGHELRTLTGHSKAVRGGAWSPDGTRILTVGDDQTARIWDAGSGQKLLTLTSHSKAVRGGAWSPDGTRILTASDDQTARIWDAGSGQKLLTLTLTLTSHHDAVRGGAWSPDGTRILTASDDQTARIWDATSGHELRTLTGHHDAVRGGAWSPDGTHILTTSNDQTARIWNATSGHELLTLTGHTSPVWDAAWSPDGTRVLTAGDDRTARIWNATSGQELLTLTGHRGWVWGGAWSPDGTHILTASVDQTARIWDATSGQKLRTLTGHTGAVWDAAWSPDRSRVLTASVDGTARIWDATSGQKLRTLTSHRDAVLGGAWSPDGTRVLTAGVDGTARIWNATSGHELLTLTGHTSPVWDAAWSPDGSRVLTASDDETARIWNATSGHELLTLTSHRDAVRGGAWSPDGTRILTTSYDETARIWDADSGEEVLTLTGHSGWVRGGAWSPDGSCVLTASDDGTARIWDALSGHPVGWRLEQLPQGELAVWSASDGHLLGATRGAWRWLGWHVPRGGELIRLPAETWGPLPPLSQPQPTP